MPSSAYMANYELQQYLQAQAAFYGPLPTPQKELDEHARRVDEAVGLAGEGPVQLVYRGVIWRAPLVLPSDPAWAAIMAADELTVIPFAVGDVMDSATTEFVASDLSIALTYAREGIETGDARLRIVFADYTTNPASLAGADDFQKLSRKWRGEIGIFEEGRGRAASRASSRDCSGD